MLGLADRLLNVPPSATLGASAKAAALQRQGRDIISLAAGEPDFDTPEHIREAATRAIQEGKTRYTGAAGLPELREAVARKLWRDNGLRYHADEISIGCGAKQSLFNALLATINPGDEVIVPAPYWVSYVDIPVLAGAETRIVRCSPDQGYKLTAEQLEQTITPRSKWLILCSPSNPSGSAYSDVDLSQLAQVLRKHPHVGVIFDHIYEHLVYDGFTAKTINMVAPDLSDRTLVINGLSKGYCMTGWRVGYVAGPKYIIDAITALQSQSTTSTSTISQWAAIAALDGDQGFIKKNNVVFKRRRDAVVSALNAIQGLVCPVPQGAFYVYPSCAELMGKKTREGKQITSDCELSDYFLNYGISVVHGSAFGLSPHFRISYAAADEVLAEACRRISTAVNELE